MSAVDRAAAQTPRQTRRQRAGWVLLVLAFVLAGTLLISAEIWLPSSAQVALEAGDVAPRDVLAPRALKYESDVLTEAKRQAVVGAVRPVYDPPDARVENEQTRLARQILDYVENVRYDDFAAPEQKRSDLAAITALSLEPNVMDAILGVQDEAKWRAIDSQVIRLLERVLSGEVREDNIQARRDDLTNLISATYSEAEARIIAGIVSDLLRVNTYYNDERTRQAQEAAAQEVPVEMRSFARGQMVIRAGEIATPAHIEALEQFGLLRETRRRTEHFLGALLAMLLVSAVFDGYFRRFHAALRDDMRFMALLGVLFLAALAGVQLLDPTQPAQPYFYPAAGLGFLVTTLVGPQLAIIVVLALAGLAGFTAQASLEYAAVIGFTGTLGVLSLSRSERLSAYFVAGGAAAIGGMVTALAFALRSDVAVVPYDLVSKLGASVVNGLLSAALALVGLYLISNLLNLATSLKVIELLQPSQPLLQRLLREAPGTYQHSLQVANLAELGAQQVNADAALLRTAAMYHDVGKILNAAFFVENQVEGRNPHDELNDPWQSVRIIIGHVTEGERLGRQYRLPRRIRDFITEHHGTTRVASFYASAQERAAQTGVVADPADFTYPGPRPRSRETAILMLADACESSVRARRPQTRDDIRETVDFIFDSRLTAGQLDDSSLTLNDLRVLRETFLSALQGVFHPRIAYPGTPGQTAPASAMISEAAPGAPPAAALTTQDFEVVRAAPAREGGGKNGGQDERAEAKADTIAG